MIIRIEIFVIFVGELKLKAMAQGYDIFISYRRDGGFATAKHLYDLLVKDGYRVSFDIDTLREGDFDVALLNRIEECTDFVLIVDKNLFDRTLDPNFNPKNDWVRKELAHALKLKKNVIPILLSGVNGFPAKLPEDVADVVTKNGPVYNQSYFDEFYRRLKLFLHSQPEAAAAGKTAKQWKKAALGALALLVVLIGGYLFSRHHVLTSEQPAVQVNDSICINPVMGEFKYTGPIDENGQPHGRGLATFAQGDTYEGDFSHGTFEGQCTYLNAAEGDRFMGTYVNNARSEGTYVWKDGTYFTGKFKNNEVYEGKLYDINGNVLEEYLGEKQ